MFNSIKFWLLNYYVKTIYELLMFCQHREKLQRSGTVVARNVATGVGVLGLLPRILLFTLKLAIIPTSFTGKHVKPLEISFRTMI